MTLLNWISEHGASLFDHGAVAAGLFFTGYSFRKDTKERRIEYAIRFTEQHNKMLSDLLSNPETARIFDGNAYAESVTQHEIQGVNFVLLHLDSAFKASKAGLYRLPEKLDTDIRNFLYLPIPREAWSQLKENHDKRFVVFLENILFQHSSDD